jgi:RimJ/RimL family protein N-acetyltransferase
MADERFCVEHTDPAGLLRAVEPTPSEARAAATQLAAYYNNAHNSAMMAHEGPMSLEDVVEFHQETTSNGGRFFLLYRDDVLVGDADFRDIAGSCAEFAIMIGDRALQGKGLGKKFAIMLHMLAFRELGLDRVYATFVPANLVSMRLFERLGYSPDESPSARAFIDEQSDIAMSVDRARFHRLHEHTMAPLRISRRAAAPG